MRPRGFESSRKRRSSYTIAGMSARMTSTLLVSHTNGFHAAMPVEAGGPHADERR